MPADRPLLSALLSRSRRHQGMLAVEEQLASLASGMSAISFWHGVPVGFLGFSARESDPAGDEGWIDLGIAAVADDVDAEPLFSSLVGMVRSQMVAAAMYPRGARVAGLSALAPEDWLRKALAASGFTETDRVISYLRSDCPPPGAQACPARLRRLSPSDSNTVLTLNSAAFEPLWRYDARRVLSWVITADHAVVAELESDGRPVGFALTTSRILEEYAQLVRLAVHPEFQGHGIGRELVVDAIKHAHDSGARGVMLNTQESNHVSRSMYAGLGFEAIAPAVPVMVCRL